VTDPMQGARNRRIYCVFLYSKKAPYTDKETRRPIYYFSQDEIRRVEFNVIKPDAVKFLDFVFCFDSFSIFDVSDFLYSGPFRASNTFYSI